MLDQKEQQKAWLWNVLEQVIEKIWGDFFPPVIHWSPSNEGYLKKYGVGEEVYTIKRR